MHGGPRPARPLRSRASDRSGGSTHHGSVRPRRERLERAVNGAFARRSSPRFSPSRSPLPSAAPWTTGPPSSATAGRSCPTSSHRAHLTRTSTGSPTTTKSLAGRADRGSPQEHAECQRYQPGGPLEVELHQCQTTWRPAYSGCAPPLPTAARRGPRRPHRAQPQHLGRHLPVAAASRSPQLPPRRQDGRGHAAAAGGTAQPRPRPRQRRRPSLARVDGERYPLIGAITCPRSRRHRRRHLDDPGISASTARSGSPPTGPTWSRSIRDLGSTNGTFVNSDACEPTPTHRPMAGPDRVSRASTMSGRRLPGQAPAATTDDRRATAIRMSTVRDSLSRSSGSGCSP